MCFKKKLFTPKAAFNFIAKTHRAMGKRTLDHKNKEAQTLEMMRKKQFLQSYP
jgi:hypothetical protein